MDNSLIVSISGLRGVIGKSLFPETALAAGRSFGDLMNGKKVVVGGDPRASHEMLKFALISGLISAGCDVIDIGVCPTPTIELAIPGLQAAGGVAITASHNPIQWNGLKFFNSRGEFLTPRQHARFKQRLLSKSDSINTRRRLGHSFCDFTWVDRHVRAVGGLKLVDVEAIKKNNFTVVLDAVNGAGSVAGPALLEMFGCRVVCLNCDPSGIFPHNPEPLPQHLKALCQEVLNNKADIGFAVDPDADRLAIVSEQGQPLGEEYTLALAADYVLSKTSGPMVINLSTSNLNQDVCHKHNCRLHRAPVGEANVVQMMRRKKAVIGGEGNGGVILPELHYGRDSLVGMALVLQALAAGGKKISELAQNLGSYTIVKSKGNIARNFDVKLARLREKLSDQKITTVDGVRVDFINGWVHIRKSNTEPVYRLIVEARTKGEARGLMSKVKGLLSQR